MWYPRLGPDVGTGVFRSYCFVIGFICKIGFCVCKGALCLYWFRLLMEDSKFLFALLKKFCWVRDCRSLPVEIRSGKSCSKLRRVSKTLMNLAARTSSSDYCLGLLKTLSELQRSDVPGLPLKSVLMPTH